MNNSVNKPFRSKAHMSGTVLTIKEMGPQLFSKPISPLLQPKASSAVVEMGPNVFHTPPCVPAMRLKRMRMYQRLPYTLYSSALSALRSALVAVYVSASWPRSPLMEWYRRDPGFVDVASSSVLLRSGSVDMLSIACLTPVWS